jgi:hypothetical protein
LDTSASASGVRQRVGDVGERHLFAEIVADDKPLANASVPAG